MLLLPRTALDLRAPLVMGVLNVTPDSFSDGGRHAGVDAALHRAAQMVDEGAAIIDIGGESTRPGAAPVSEQEELDRVVPVIEAVCREFETVVSVDTTKPAVMRAACRAGAQIVNDINALREPGSIEAVRDSGAAVCLMHMQGEPRTMQQHPVYEDVLLDVRAFLQERLRVCTAAGIEADRILLDPGIGFGKTLAHNLALLAGLPVLMDLGRPLLVGVSRKSMFQHLLGRDVTQRLPASLATASVAAWLGAAIVRAHDIRATADALATVIAIQNAGREV